MKKLFLALFMAVAAVITISAQETVSLYVEHPTAAQYTDFSQAPTKQVLTLSPGSKDRSIDINVKAGVIRYWFKQTEETTFLVLMTKQNEKVTVWFKDAAAELPVLDWTNAVVKFNNGHKVTLKFPEKKG